MPSVSLKKLPYPKTGIGLLLAFILLLIFAIQDAPNHPGMTRLQVLWAAIMGYGSLDDLDGAGDHTNKTAHAVDQTSSPIADGAAAPTQATATNPFPGAIYTPPRSAGGILSGVTGAGGYLQ